MMSSKLAISTLKVIAVCSIFTGVSSFASENVCNPDPPPLATYEDAVTAGRILGTSWPLTACGLTDEQVFNDVGGEFDYTIPNFRGFKQEQSNWCWAAITKTILFGLTGAEMPESQLARIQFSTDDFMVAPHITGVDPQTCDGNQASTERCNHAGDTELVLSYFKNLDSTIIGPNQALDVLQALRASLSKNVPVGLNVSMGPSEGHALVIYGASFKMGKVKSSPAMEISLKVFDPFDGSTSEMTAGGYKFENRSSFLSRLFHLRTETAPIKNFYFVDYQNTQIPQDACQFLEPSDQAKFCK